MGNELEGRWSKVDKIEIGFRSYLRPDDKCFYYLERSRENWSAGAANSLVSNFQKDLVRFRDRPDVMSYKEEAIEFFARKITLLVGHRMRQFPIALVPAVTSKPKCHPSYDSRLLLTARAVERMLPQDTAVCDVLDLTQELPKAKVGGPRDPEGIERFITVDDRVFPLADTVFLIDDVLVTGGHFAACRNAIAPVFPNAEVVGIFLAKEER